MSGDARIDELAARLSLAQGTPTLLVLVAAEPDASLDDTRARLSAVLRNAPMDVADLGSCDLDTGPARWVELTHSRAADAYVISAAPWGPFSGSAFAVLLNAEREFLRKLAGPVLLLVSRETERVIRQKAPDFFTWAARTYELPAASELSAIARRMGDTEGRPMATAPEEAPVRFLHLSDLHLRPTRVKKYDQDRVLRGLVDFLERDRERFPLDLVFVTGDLAHAGKPEEFGLVRDLFQRILDVTGVSPNHFFVVPGNHDVDRDVGRWLRRTLDKDEDAITFFEDEDARRFHLQKLGAYKAALGPLLGAFRALGLGVGAEAVEIVNVRGAKLAIASFNSAFFAQGDDDHGKLWLGEPNVDRAGDKIADEGVNFAIALLHHPFEELAEIERDSVERRFERLFDLVLRGHMHQAKSRGIVSQRGGYVELAAPSAYQGSPWPNGCYLGELRPRAGSLRVFPYAYASGADPWVLDTKVFPDDAAVGYSRTFNVPEKRRTPSVLRRHLAKATEDAVRAAPEAVQRQVARELGIETPNQPMSKAFSKKAAKAASARFEDAASVQGMLGPDHMGRHMALSAIEMLKKEQATPRISRAEPQFLAQTLVRVSDALKNLKFSHTTGRMDHERILLFVIASLFEFFVDGPISIQPTLEEGCRPDILIGTAADPPEMRAVVEIYLMLFKPSDQFAPYIEKLDKCLSAANAAHGALVIPYKPSIVEPTIERIHTRSGREILVLTTPLVQ